MSSSWLKNGCKRERMCSSPFSVGVRHREDSTEVSRSKLAAKPPLLLAGLDCWGQHVIPTTRGFYRIIEWLELGGMPKINSFQPTCHEQRHLPQDGRWTNSTSWWSTSWVIPELKWRENQTNHTSPAPWARHKVLGIISWVKELTTSQYFFPKPGGKIFLERTVLWIETHWMGKRQSWN